jgi:hypothetical protein
MSRLKLAVLNRIYLLIFAAFALSAPRLAIAEANDPFHRRGPEIAGMWAIHQSNGLNSVWRFNPDFTYNYWDQTGKFTCTDNRYLLKHTWDWQVTMPNADTFEGVCIRGNKGCRIHGTRLKDDFPARIVGKWNIVQSDGTKAEWSFNKDYTYNYWKMTGLFRDEGDNYFLCCTWDWKIKMPNADSFEGVCTRGKVGCTIRGERVK